MNNIIKMILSYEQSAQFMDAIMNFVNYSNKFVKPIVL